MIEEKTNLFTITINDEGAQAVRNHDGVNVLQYVGGSMNVVERDLLDALVEARRKLAQWEKLKITRLSDVEDAGKHMMVLHTAKFTKYHPKARQQGYGKGRWQLANGYGGWDNANWIDKDSIGISHDAAIDMLKEYTEKRDNKGSDESSSS